MAALTSASVVVTVNERRIVGKKRRNRVTIVFGDGVSTYPALGVPMPTAGSFGMIRQLDFLHVYDESNPDGYIYKYDSVNNKIRIYAQGVNTGATAAADSASGALAKTSAGAEGAVRAMGTVASTAYDLGAMNEITTAITPASLTLVAEAVGW
jgi:hypothetical protein